MSCYNYLIQSQVSINVGIISASLLNPYDVFYDPLVLEIILESTMWYYPFKILNLTKLIQTKVTLSSEEPINLVLKCILAAMHIKFQHVFFFFAKTCKNYCFTEKVLCLVMSYILSGKKKLIKIVLVLRLSLFENFFTLYAYWSQKLIFFDMVLALSSNFSLTQTHTDTYINTYLIWMANVQTLIFEAKSDQICKMINTIILENFCFSSCKSVKLLPWERHLIFI